MNIVTLCDDVQFSVPVASFTKFCKKSPLIPMLRDTLQETNTNSSKGSWVVGKMSFPTSIGRICRQFPGGYGISGSPEGNYQSKLEGK